MGIRKVPTVEKKPKDRIVWQGSVTENVVDMCSTYTRYMDTYSMTIVEKADEHVVAIISYGYERKITMEFPLDKNALASLAVKLTVLAGV